MLQLLQSPTSAITSGQPSLPGTVITIAASQAVFSTTMHALMFTYMSTWNRSVTDVLLVLQVSKSIKL